MTTMNEAERKEFLGSLGLNAQAPALAADITPDLPAHEPRSSAKAVTLAPDGIDPHTMPVSDIEFAPALLDNFPSLEGAGMNAASRYVFELYKSAGRNKDRNSLLHRKITEFIGRERLSRRMGGQVTGLVKATKEQRDLAAVLAEKGLTVEDLMALL